SGTCTPTRVTYLSFFFQAEDGIRYRNVTSSDVCSSDLGSSSFWRDDPGRGGERQARRQKLEDPVPGSECSQGGSHAARSEGYPLVESEVCRRVARGHEGNQGRRSARRSADR